MFIELHAPRGCGYSVADYKRVQNELYRARYKIKCLLRDRDEYEQVMMRELNTYRQTIVYLKDHLDESETKMASQEKELNHRQLLIDRLKDSLHESQNKTANRKKELKCQQKKLAEQKQSLKELKTKVRDEAALRKRREDQLLMEINRLELEVGEYKQKCDDLELTVPQMTMTAATTCDDVLPISTYYHFEQFGITTVERFKSFESDEEISEFSDFDEFSDKCMDSSVEDESNDEVDSGEEYCPAEEQSWTEPKAASSGVKSQMVTGYGFEETLERSDSESSSSALLSNKEESLMQDPVELTIGSNMTYCIPRQVLQFFRKKLKKRNEHIFNLQSLVENITRFSINLEENVDYLGHFFQQICEQFRPRWQEIDTLVLRPLAETHDSQYWCDVLTTTLGVTYTGKRDVMELCKEWLQGNSHYPVQWKSLLDRFQKSGHPQLESIANLLQTRLHEAIPHGRLSSPETIGRDKLCVACNTPLCPCLRRFTPDPFDANEVSAQEETPFGNPTEAQV